jgi:hypothetical protein
MRPAGAAIRGFGSDGHEVLASWSSSEVSLFEAIGSFQLFKVAFEQTSDSGHLEQSRNDYVNAGHGTYRQRFTFYFSTRKNLPGTLLR